MLTNGVLAVPLAEPVVNYPLASFVNASSIVAAGEMNGDLATFRITPEGVVDNSFDGDGSVVTDVSRGGLWDWATDAVPYNYQGANKILVASKASALVRYNANGTLDNSFGTKGIVKVDSDYFKDLLVQEGDGKILALGSTGLYRYSAAGAIDRSFGGNGIVEVQYRTCFALQKVGNEQYVVTGGIVPGAQTYDFILSRYRLTDGSLDTTFGNNGSIVTDFGFNDFLRDLEVTPSNEIIAVGRGWGGAFGFPIIARYDSAGHEINRIVTRDVTKTTLTTGNDRLIEASVDREGRATPSESTSASSTSLGRVLPLSPSAFFSHLSEGLLLRVLRDGGQ